MRSRTAGIAISALFTLATSAFAQTQTPPPQQPRTPEQPQTQQPQQTKSSDTAATQTFTGCLMSETDYRKAHNLGGGAMGGVGLGDEFVLVNVKVSPAKSTSGSSSSSGMTSGTSSSSSSQSSTSSSSSQTGSQSATSANKCVDQGTAYRLTGSAEDNIKGLVGKHLEVQGKLKKADSTATGAATDPTAEKEKLPAEVEIISYREAPGREPLNDSPAPAMSQSSALQSSASQSSAAQSSADQPARAQTAQPQSQSTAQQPQTAQPTPPARDQAPARDQSTDPAQRDLPKTASSTPLFGLVGVLALASGIALTVIRRRRTA